MQERVRAIIVEKGAVLTFKRVKLDEIYWAFPGGGIEDGEEMEDALVRECKEELGVDVQVQELMFENTFVHKKYGEQKEYFYRCVIVGGELGTGDGPEFQENSNYEGTHELEWLDMNKLEKYDLRPEEVKKRLIENF